MPRYFLQLAYKGTQYSGFQVQQNANTVQSEVQKAMAIFFRQTFELTGSSRTDAGVHAYQNYFHFNADLPITLACIYHLNALLPGDITVKGIYQVPDIAHCRFDAVSREYQYLIYRSKDPFLEDRGWLYPYTLDTGFLQEAAGVLTEYEDFTSFAKRKTQVKSFMCRLERSEWIITGDTLVYLVKANRFLRGMVRGMVGTMVKLARNGSGISAFRSVIEGRDCTRADFSTPARGLFLKEVAYPETISRYLK